MLDATIKTQLKAYLEKLQRPIELVASLDDSAKAEELRALPTPGRVHRHERPKSGSGRRALGASRT